jgi:4-amino-4-deoxy-L-arabinose transferase-like glycosyltransferase
VSDPARFLGLRDRDPRRHLLALLVLLLCGALLWTSERGRSLTADEPLHLVRGHALWWTHSSQLSYAHPPLANAITSLPQAGRGDQAWGLGATPDGQPRAPKQRRRGPGPDATRAEAMTSLPGWEVVQPLDVSTAYFRHDFRAAKAELISARRMMMLWTLALGLFIYVWCERRWGFATAISALIFYSLHPTLLAHGQLVTTDMPLAATVFVSLAALIAWIERPSWLAVLGFGVATTAMVLSKHTGLAYVVVMSLMLLGVAALGRGGFATPGGRVRHVALTAAQLSLVAAAMILAIDAMYLFDRVGLSVAEILAEPEPHNWISKKHEYELLERSPLARLPDGLRLPVPYTWLLGLATVSEQNAMGHGNYFFGVRGDSGHPLYFPVLLFAKSPTGLLLLLGLGLGLGVRRLRARHAPSLATSVLLGFSALAFLSACASDINIGVRHVLPLLPIMTVLAGRVAAKLIESTPELPPALHGRRGRALVGACMLGCALGAASTFPAWLGDFNVLVGGPSGGHRISVIGEDWGQDLGDLADLAEAQGWTGLAYHTTFPLRREELEARGLELHKLGCKQVYRGTDPVVIHLSDWVRRRSCFTWLRERSPAHVVNHHMLVFE